MKQSNDISKNYVGIVLAAGFGSRLKPMTSVVPKPLVPFMGVSLLYINIYRLESLGLKKLIVNAHYLSEQIIEAIKQYPSEVSIHTSVEKNILGTGGVYGKVSSELDGKSVVAINGDIISDFPIDKLMAHHESLDAKASMGVLPQAHKDESNIWCKDGRVVAIGKQSNIEGATPHGFSCIQILSGNFIKKIPINQSSSIIKFYQEALESGEIIGAYVHDCFWYDLGTPKNYWKAHKEYLDKLNQNPKVMDFDTLGFFKFSSEKMGLCYKLISENYSDKRQNTFEGPSLIRDGFVSNRRVHVGPYAVITGKAHCEDVSISYSVFDENNNHLENSNFTRALYHKGTKLSFD